MKNRPQPNPNDTPEQAEYRESLIERFEVHRRRDWYMDGFPWYWAFEDFGGYTPGCRPEVGDERSAHRTEDEAWEAVCDEIDVLVESLVEDPGQ